MSIARRCPPVLITALATAAAVAPAIAGANELVGPVTFGSPDQPFGVRRAVTAADRALIRQYRARPPTFAANFASAAALDTAFNRNTDDQAALKSCRRPNNVEPSGAGLRFRTTVATECRARWATGSVSTKAAYGFGFYEVSMKIADVQGMNNAFWLTTSDHYEIDVGEVQFPSYSHIGLQYWPVTKGAQHAGVGFAATFAANLAYDFHDYGVLWTTDGLVFEVDGEPVAALVTGGAVRGAATVRLSAALADWARGPVPTHPEGHGMVVRSLRISSG